ncbi:MAG: shikimate kinase [Lachnospiraceae bacterium]|jgi:shikimate kinase|nr:shikimate kinase [Lachnospiraceae bacterium]
MKYNIYLIGFMGTGKSTVSASLARLFGYEEIDTDIQIASQQNQSISEIFESQGELAFRDMETKLLQELAGEKHKIISCGGGMAMRKENVALMQQNGVVVLLTAKPETILSRVQQDKGRPILQGNMNVAYICELLQQRSPFYQDAGEIVVATDDRTPEEIAEEIKKNIKFGKICFDF